MSLPPAARLSAALLSAVVAVVSYRYLAGGGPVPPNIAGNRFVDTWIVVHAGAAATALLTGPIQFLPAVRRRRPGAHRWTGRAYVLGCLVGGASALVLAAVTLRLYLPISATLGLDFVTAYRIIAWLAWVPNAILAELYLHEAERARTGMSVTSKEPAPCPRS